MYRSLVRNKDLYNNYTACDPAPRYEALFFLIGFYPNRTTPFLRLDQRAMGDESKNYNEKRIMKKFEQ